MATPNYGYEKRQRELAKKKKKEEKLKAKAEGKRHADANPEQADGVADTQDAPPADSGSGGEGRLG